MKHTTKNRRAFLEPDKGHLQENIKSVMKGWVHSHPKVRKKTETSSV